MANGKLVVDIRGKVSCPKCGWKVLAKVEDTGTRRSFVCPRCKREMGSAEVREV